MNGHIEIDSLFLARYSFHDRDDRLLRRDGGYRMLQSMAWIETVPDDRIPEQHRVGDSDNIIRIHGVHAAVMRRHVDLYLELMRKPGPLTRTQREMIAVVVSAENRCRY